MLFVTGGLMVGSIPAPHHDQLTISCAVLRFDFARLRSQALTLASDRSLGPNAYSPLPSLRLETYPWLKGSRLTPIFPLLTTEQATRLYSGLQRQPGGPKEAPADTRIAFVEQGIEARVRYLLRCAPGADQQRIPRR